MSEEELEELSYWGREATLFGDTEAFQVLRDKMTKYGLYEAAERLDKAMVCTMKHWEEKYDYNIYYDEASRRYRAVQDFHYELNDRDYKAGQYVPNPYDWVR